MNIFALQVFSRPIFLQGDFSQLPLSMQVTFIVVALGTAYAVWILVVRSRIKNPVRLAQAERRRLDALAQAAQFGAPLPGLCGVLDRINLSSLEDERAYTAVQCYERGVVAVSLQRECWQAEAVIPYKSLGTVRSYQERDVTGLRAALLGPFAFWLQIKLHFLGIVLQSSDGMIQNFVFQGKKALIARLIAHLDRQKNPLEIKRSEALTEVS